MISSYPDEVGDVAASFSIGENRLADDGTDTFILAKEIIQAQGCIGQNTIIAPTTGKIRGHGNGGLRVEGSRNRADWHRPFQRG